MLGGLQSFIIHLSFDSLDRLGRCTNLPADTDKFAPADLFEQVYKKKLNLQWKLIRGRY